MGKSMPARIIMIASTTRISTNESPRRRLSIIGSSDAHHCIKTETFERNCKRFLRGRIPIWPGTGCDAFASAWRRRKKTIESAGNLIAD